MTQGSVKDTTGYVNYVYNISARGTTQVASQLMGLSGMATNVLGQLAFQTSSYLSTTEGALLSMGVIATAGFTKATQHAMEFDQALSTVGAISGKTRDEVTGLGEQAMAMSNKFGVATSEMTKGLESLARAGVSTNNMFGILEQAMGLSKLEGLSLDTAINSLISTTNLLDTQNLDLSSPEYAEAVAYQNQKITATSEAAPINAQDIIHTLEHVGGYASSTNLDQDDLYAVIAQLGSKGTKSEMAGTSLRAFLAAGQKDTAQRALQRIGLSVSDLWKDDETILSISDMKDVLDEAMEAKGYTQQEKLEFYSDFAGYKQANQIMKIDTSSVREFKEKIDHSWDMGKKINQVIGTAETHVQGLIQAGTNLLTKVGEPFLPIISTIAWTLRTGIDMINMIPGSNLVIAGGLVLASVKAISTIFNKIVPQLIAAKGNIGGISGLFRDMKDDLNESYTIIKNIGNADFMQRRTLKNEKNRITDDDRIKYWQEKTGAKLFGMPDVYELEKIHGYKEKDKRYKVWKIGQARVPTRNERQKSQNPPKSASESSNNRKQNQKTECCDLIVQTLTDGFVTQIAGFNGIINELQKIHSLFDGDKKYTIDESVLESLKSHTFKVEISKISDNLSFGGGGSSSSGETVVETQTVVVPTGTTPTVTSSSETLDFNPEVLSSVKHPKKPKTNLLSVEKGRLDPKKVEKFIDELDINFGYDKTTVEGRASHKLANDLAKDILRDNFKHGRIGLKGQDKERIEQRIHNIKNEPFKMPISNERLGSVLASEPDIISYTDEQVSAMRKYPTIDYDPGAVSNPSPKLKELDIDYNRLTGNYGEHAEDYLLALAKLGKVDTSKVKKNTRYKSNIANAISDDLSNEDSKNKSDIHYAKGILDKVLTNQTAYHYINDLNSSQRNEFMKKVGLESSDNPLFDMAKYIEKLKAEDKIGSKEEWVNLGLIQEIGNIVEINKDKLKVTQGYSSYRGDLTKGPNVKNEINAATEKAIKLQGTTGYGGFSRHIEEITDGIVEMAIQEDILARQKYLNATSDKKYSISQVINSSESLVKPNRYKYKHGTYDDEGAGSPDALNLNSTIYQASQQMHDDKIGGGEKYKTGTEGGDFQGLETRKLVFVDEAEAPEYFKKEKEELKNLSFYKAMNFLDFEENRGAHEDIGPKKLDGNNVGIKTVGVSEIEALPFMFEGTQISGVFRRKSTHGRDFMNTAVFKEDEDGNKQLLGFLPNESGKYHEAYSWALQRKRNRGAMQRNQAKIFGHIGLNYDLSRQDIMNMPISEAQDKRIQELYNQQDFVNIEEFVKRQNELYKAATPEQRKTMLTGEEALKQIRGQMAAARKVEVVKDKKGNEFVKDMGGMFEIEVTPEEYERRKKDNLIYLDEGQEGVLSIRTDSKGNDFYTINDFEALHYSKKDLTRKVVLEDVLRAKELERQKNILDPEVENFGEWYNTDISSQLESTPYSIINTDKYVEYYNKLYNEAPLKERKNMLTGEEKLNKLLEESKLDSMQILDSFIIAKSDGIIEDMSQYDIVKELGSVDDLVDKILEAPEDQMSTIMYGIYMFDEQLYNSVRENLKSMYNHEIGRQLDMREEKDKMQNKLKSFDIASDNVLPKPLYEFTQTLTNEEKAMLADMGDFAYENIVAMAFHKKYLTMDEYEDLTLDQQIEKEFYEELQKGSQYEDIHNENLTIEDLSVANEIEKEFSEDFKDSSQLIYDTRSMMNTVGVGIKAERMDKIKKALDTDIKENEINEYKRILGLMNATHDDATISGGPLSGSILNAISAINKVNYLKPLPDNIVYKEVTPDNDEEPTILGEDEIKTNDLIQKAMANPNLSYEELGIEIGSPEYHAIREALMQPLDEPFLVTQARREKESGGLNPHDDVKKATKETEVFYEDGKKRTRKNIGSRFEFIDSGATTEEETNIFGSIFKSGIVDNLVGEGVLDNSALELSNSEKEKIYDLLFLPINEVIEDVVNERPKDMPNPPKIDLDDEFGMPGASWGVYGGFDLSREHFTKNDQRKEYIKQFYQAIDDDDINAFNIVLNRLSNISKSYEDYRILLNRVNNLDSEKGLAANNVKSLKSLLIPDIRNTNPTDILTRTFHDDDKLNEYKEQVKEQNRYKESIHRNIGEENEWMFGLPYSTLQINGVNIDPNSTDWNQTKESLKEAQKYTNRDERFSQFSIPYDVLSEYKNQKKQETYETLSEYGANIKERLNNFVTSKTNSIYERFGKDDSKENISEVNEKLKGFISGLDNVDDVLQGFSKYLQEAADVFPPLSIAVVGLETVISTITAIESGTLKLQSFLSIGDRLRQGESFEFLNKTFSSNNNAGKLLMSATGMVGEAFESLTTIFWEFLGPITLIVAGLIAIKGALDWSYQSHKKYLESLQEEQKEKRSKSKGLQITNENAQEQARNNRAPRQQAALDRNAQLRQTQLDNANMSRSYGAIEIARQKNDTLWGDYGIAAGLGKLQGNYESTAAEYDGTTGQIRRIKEATLANPFSSDSMNQVASYYDANQLAFGVMDEYKDELGKLYDAETSAMLKYHSDDVRGSPEFNKALDDFVEATGITRDHAQQYLDYMQTEHEVDKATQSMQAQADQIAASTELKVQAIAFGGNPADVLGLNGIEAQQGAMIKAQADMVKMELSGQLWWKAVWSTITTPVKLILSPLFIITDLLSAIWSFITGNWGDAFDKAGRAGSRLNVFGEAATYWGAWADTEATDFNAIGQSATDSYNRANYGNVEQSASGGYHPTYYLDANANQDRRESPSGGYNKPPSSGGGYVDHRESSTHYIDANRGSYHFLNRNNTQGSQPTTQLNPLSSIGSLLGTIISILTNGLLIGGGIYGVYKLLKSDFSVKALGEGLLSTIKGEGSNLLGDIFNVEGITGKTKDILGKFFNIEGIKKRVGGITGPSIENEDGELTRYGQLVKAKEDFLSNNAWGNYLGEKLMPDDFNKKKRKGMNESDRDYLIKRYGLDLDLDERDEKGRRKYRTADQKNKAVRQALDDQGKWDEAVRDLHNNKYMGKSLKDRVTTTANSYIDPWKEYLGKQYETRKQNAKDNINGYIGGLQEEAERYRAGDIKEEDVSSGARLFARGLDIKEQVFGKAENTNFQELLADPKAFLSDPRKIEGMARDIYGANKDKFAGSDFMATVGAYRERPDIMENAPIHAKLMGKALDWKDKYLQGDSITDVLKDPERTVDILQGTWKDLNGGALDDLNIGQTVKDKVSGFFNDIKEGAEEGIDDDEEGGSGGIIQKAKEKLAGFFGFGKEDTSPITKEEIEEKEESGDFKTISDWKKEKVEEIQTPSLPNRITNKMKNIFGSKKEEEPISNIGKMANMDIEGRDALIKSGLSNGKTMGNTFIESTSGAADEDASILDIVEEGGDLLSSDNLSKGGKGLSKVGKTLSGKGGKLGKAGNLMSKIGGGMSKAGSKGVGGAAKGGIGKLAKGGVGKGLGKVGGKIAGKIGGKVASKALAQVGSKVLGGALMATGVGAPLGLLLESPIGGFLMEGAMDLGGKALGAIGGALGGVGNAIGGLFGFGKKTHYQQAGQGAGPNPLGMLMPGVGALGAITGGIGGMLGGMFGGGNHGVTNMGAASGAGIMKMVSPLSMGVGLLSSIFKNNRDHKNKSSNIGDIAKHILKNVIDGFKQQPSNQSSGGNITIQNININTADDPEAIKAMFLELLIELQEQVNPRLVSRTVGEPPASSSTDTNTPAQDAQEQQDPNDPSNQNTTGSGVTNNNNTTTNN